MGSRDVIRKDTLSSESRVSAKIKSAGAPVSITELATLKDLSKNAELKDLVLKATSQPPIPLETQISQPILRKNTTLQIERCKTQQASLVQKDVYFGNTLFLEGLASSVSLDHSDTRGTFLNIELPNPISEVDINLGKLQCFQFIAGTRQKVWWMVPGWGKDATEIPTETQFLLMRLTPDGTPADQEQYAIILPLVSGPFRSALKPGPSGSVVLHVETGDSETVRSIIDNTVFIASGSDPYKLLSEGFAAAAGRIKTFKPREGKQLPKYFDFFGYCTWNAFHRDISAPGIVKELESFRDAGVPVRTLIIDDGWQDTVNPYQEAVIKSTSVEKMLKQLIYMTRPFVEWFYHAFVWRQPRESLGFQFWRTWSKVWPLKNYVEDKFADDNADCSRRLRSPEPNAKFLATTRTGQLRDFVSQVKEEIGINEVYAWHSLLGYWGGIQPDSAAWKGTSIEMATLKPMKSILDVEPQMEFDPLVLSDQGLAPPDQLYDSMHGFLSSSGVDGVKIDIQAVTTMLGEKRGGSRKVTNDYLLAAERSVQKHFGSSSQMINCMSHASECLYSVNASSVVRASDDFWPTDDASHSTHIVHVAFNSLFIGEIAQPDWDMFQSKHPAAGLHAAARAVGGGPVYVSDTPGEHNFELLRRLVLPDGSVLRATLPGRPTRDSLFANVTADGQSALKVWNRNRRNGVLGAFNVQGASWDRVRRDNFMHGSHPERVEGVLRASDVEGLVDPQSPSDSEFVLSVLHLAADGDLVNSSKVTLRGNESLPFSLPFRNSLVATVAPIRLARAAQADGSTRSVKWAALGLEGMLNGGAAVVSEAETPQDPGGEGGGAEYAEVEVAGSGTLVLHCEAAPAAVLLDAQHSSPNQFSWSPEHQTLRVPFKPQHGRTTAIVQVAF